MYCFLDLAGPGCSVGSVHKLRTGVPGSISGSANFFPTMILVVAIEFTPLSNDPIIVSTMVMRESSQWHGRNIAKYYLENKIQGSMGSCMGCRDINEIKLKTALNAIQSIGKPSLLHCQIIKLNKLILNPFPNKPCILRVCSVSLLKTA